MPTSTCNHRCDRATPALWWMEKSSLGPGAKAGGPYYTALFSRFEDTTDAAEDYQRWWSEYFSLEHDPSGLRCESNHLRYRLCRGVLLRLEHDDAIALSHAKTIAKITGVALHVSLGTQETQADLAARLPALASQVEFLRTIQTPVR